ncbi:hypothetical protein KKI19_00305 [Patescibacteria group bacterium]|nr:hypothetical protein [Patescibacteria group bacterium]
MKIIKRLNKTEIEGLKIGERLNKQVLFLLPEKIVWYEVLLEGNEVDNLRIINDRSWPKEFPSARTVKAIAKVILEEGVGREHTARIKKIAESTLKPNREPLVILLARDFKDTYTIIDGHHRLIAKFIEREIGELRAILGLFGRQKCVLVK